MAISNTDSVLTPTQKSFGLAVIGIDKLKELTESVENPRLSDALYAAIRNDCLVFSTMWIRSAGLYWVEQFKEFRITKHPKDGFALIADIHSLSPYGPEGIQVVPNWSLSELLDQVHQMHFGFRKDGEAPLALIYYLMGVMPEWAITPEPITINTNDLRVFFRYFITDRTSSINIEKAFGVLDQIMTQTVSGRKPLSDTGYMFARKLDQVKKRLPNHKELDIAIDQFNARIRHLAHLAYDK